MLQEKLGREVNEGLQRFLWRQWSQLGLAGEVEFQDRWVIDPEALLVFTLLFGRHDARLFDEVVDWTVRNGRLLSIQRLKNIMDARNDGAVSRTLSALAMVVDSRDPKSRWSRLAHSFTESEAAPESFFLDLDEKPFAVVGDPDEHFLRTGYLRSRVHLRGLSQPVPMRPLTNLIFRLRSLFGLGPRAEVLAYLLTNSDGQASVIAQATHYSRTQVQEALGGLVQADAVTAQPRGRRRTFSTDVGRWLRLLDLPNESLPLWVNWPQVFDGLLDLATLLARLETQQQSDYLVKSDTLTLSNHLRQALAYTGLMNPFEKPLGLEESAEHFVDRVRSLIEQLVNGASVAPGKR